MAITKIWKVYGAEGHRQRLSFGESARYDFSRDGKIRIIEIETADKTGTNDYVIVKITRDTADECDRELDGQLSDGFFENSRYGKVEEVVPDEVSEAELKKSKANAVRELAKRFGSQRVLATVFGIPLRTVENWCRGEREIPGYTLSMMRKELELKEEIEKLKDMCFEQRSLIAKLGEEIRKYEEAERVALAAQEGKKMLYILHHELNGDDFCLGCYWKKADAESFGRAEKGKTNRGNDLIYINGFYVETEEKEAEAAFKQLLDKFEDEPWLPDADFYEEIN